MSLTKAPVDYSSNDGIRLPKRHDLRTQRAVKIGALVFAVIALSSVTLLLGRYTVTIPDFFRILGGADIPGASFIVMENRLPRVIIGVMIGAAFGVAGAIFQTMLRNPLASPDIIGISYGASASAVFAIVLLGASGLVLSGFAMIGALAVALAIYFISRRGGVAGYRLILVGIGFSAVLQSVVSFLLTRTDINVATDALVWLNGSLNSSNWDRVSVLALALMVLAPAVVALSRSLRGLELGDDTAAGLGVNVERSRLSLIVTGVLLAAVATAAAGPVSFIAFLSGPIARRFLNGHRPLLTAGLVGAVIVLAADFIGANLIPDVSLPVGVITGVLGAPFLLWLLATSNRSGQGG
ncbi:iron complex transport system permease protein [Arthrobacter pigmenti]|uniref:Iron complex transport system permease protein n=1 Tax=Arthrobacter pigmenti TaxID=271432 RepID=A0A846RJY1_9MICC|nr:iron chelate uptake ABC transporter family permease subunit [Arthrobacter pigmenti]NJC23543.1 iron complex transport system permease protein [Arthrobacter pigmenti]